MAQLNIGGTMEDVITSEEFTLDMARGVLKKTKSWLLSATASRAVAKP